MLAIKRTNINDVLNQREISKLPLNLWERVEDMLEITISILVYEIRECVMKVQIMNVYNNNIEKELFIDNAHDENIKLSSDGNLLIYMDVNFNISYLNINTNKIIKSINISNTNIFPNYYYFDRNGLYYITSNSIETYVFDINNKQLVNIFPASSNYNLISEDYTKICCRSRHKIEIYDFINTNKLHSLDLNNFSLGYVDKHCNFVLYILNENIIKIRNINNKDEYNYVNDDYDEITGIAFHPNNEIVALYLLNYLILFNMKTNKIQTIDDLPNDNLIENNIEFTNDGNYLIIKYYDSIKALEIKPELITG
jgi:hypothetical protein